MSMQRRARPHRARASNDNTEFAFYNRLRFNDKDTFRHFGFQLTHPMRNRPRFRQKAIELLSKSRHIGDQLGTAQLFLQACSQERLQRDSQLDQSASLGDAVPTNWMLFIALAPRHSLSARQSRRQTTPFSLLPLGGRIKVDPWSDQLQMIKSKPVGAVAENEKEPFEVTPIAVYLTRLRGKPSELAGAISLNSATDADDDHGASNPSVKQ